MLSCSCEYDDPDYYFVPPVDYSTLQTSRRKRCWSCNDLIDVGALVLEFGRHRPPRSDIEERIYGECGEIYLADKFHCEKCGDIYFNLSDAGFECLDPGESMRQAMKEYLALVEEVSRR